MTEFGHPGNPDVFPFSKLSNSNQKRGDGINFLATRLQSSLDPPATQSSWHLLPQLLPLGCL